MFGIVYNVISNKQFLIFTRSAWTRPDPRVNPTLAQLWLEPMLVKYC